MSQVQPVPRRFPRPPRNTRLVGLGSPGPRVRAPSQSPAPSTRSPSPAVDPLSSRSAVQPAPKERQKCKNCGGTNFEDAGNGQTVCTECGVIAHDSGNYASEVAFSDDATGRTVQQGVRIGMNQTHQSTYTPNRGGQFGYINQGGGISSADRAKADANSYFGTLQGPLQIQTLEIHRALNIFTYAYASGFVRGRSIESVATVALYLATRAAKKRLVEQKQQPYSLMLIDFAEKAGMNVFDLGRTMQDMVKKLYLNVGDDEKLREASLLLQAPGAEALVDKFVDNLDFPSDIAPRIKDDATKILQRMKRDWIHHGRRPSGVCGAAVILAARMNNYRRTLREVVLCAKVTEITVSKRLEEFQETASSKLSVNEFRSDEVREAVVDMDPPAFYLSKQPKKRRRTQRNGAPETAAEIEDGQSDVMSDADEVADEDEEPIPKRARIDADGFAVPDIPIRSSQTPSSQSESRSGPGRPKGSKNWVAPPPTDAELVYETEMQNEIQEALDDNRDLDVAQTNDLSEEPSREPTIEDVQVKPHEISPQQDPPGPSVWSNEGNTGNVSVDPELGETEFDDDPEVSNCLLNEAERALKERIWVTENAEWLRQDHAKRIRRELKDQHLREQGKDPEEERRLRARNNLRRKDGARRSGRVGDVGYLNDEFHKKRDNRAGGTEGGDAATEAEDETADTRSVGRRASDAVRKMMNQRGVYSRRINYDNLMKSYQLPGEEEEEEPSSTSRSQSPSRDRNTREESILSEARSARLLDSGPRRSNGNQPKRKASTAAPRRKAAEQSRLEEDTATRLRTRSQSRSPSLGPSVAPSGRADSEASRDNVEAEEADSPAPGHAPTTTSSEGQPSQSILPTPPPTQFAPNPAPARTRPSPTPESADSPLSSTHTPQSTDVDPTPKPPSGQNPAVNEDDIDSDEDDYVEDEDEDEDDGDGDGVDAALAGQYGGVEWDDELVEDE